MIKAIQQKKYSSCRKYYIGYMRPGLRGSPGFIRRMLGVGSRDFQVRVYG